MMATTLTKTDITNLIQVDDAALAVMPIEDIEYVLKTFVDRGAAAYRHLGLARSAATDEERTAQVQMAIQELQGTVSVVLPSTRAAASEGGDA